MLEACVGVGVVVTGAATAMATAIGVGVGTAMPVPSVVVGVVVPPLESVVLVEEASAVDELDDESPELSFESLDLPRERGGALLLPLASVLLLEAGLLLSFWF